MRVPLGTALNADWDFVIEFRQEWLPEEPAEKESQTTFVACNFPDANNRGFHPRLHAAATIVANERQKNAKVKSVLDQSRFTDCEPGVARWVAGRSSE
jgi:hypothetical protein